MWCALDLMPFDYVESVGTKLFFKKNFPSIQLPCRQTLSVQGLDDVYEIVKKKVVDDLLGVKTICVMFDGWSDSQGYPYLGLRIAYISQWEHRLVTISCKMLKGHTAVNMSRHVREELDSFVDGGTKNISIFTTHDGAANMVRASKLLNSEQFTHCLAHALHLLLVTDGLNKCPDIQELIEKCSSIVNKLHFKGCELQEEKSVSYKDIPALEDILDKIAEAKEVLSFDSQNPVEDQTEEMENELATSSIANVRVHVHATLKNPLLQDGTLPCIC